MNWRCLRCNFQRQLYVQSAGAFNKMIQRLALHELHRVEVVLTGSAQM